jgi:hypothetical protein
MVASPVCGRSGQGWYKPLSSPESHVVLSGVVIWFSSTHIYLIHLLNSNLQVLIPHAKRLIPNSFLYVNSFLHVTSFSLSCHFYVRITSAISTQFSSVWLQGPFLDHIPILIHIQIRIHRTGDLPGARVNSGLVRPIWDWLYVSEWSGCWAGQKDGLESGLFAFRWGSRRGLPVIPVHHWGKRHRQKMIHHLLVIPLSTLVMLEQCAGRLFTGQPSDVPPCAIGATESRQNGHSWQNNQTFIYMSM